jgi:hypothetical protein
MILVTKIKILKDQIYRSQVMIAIKIITKISEARRENLNGCSTAKVIERLR